MLKDLKKINFLPRWISIIIFIFIIFFPHLLAHLNPNPGHYKGAFESSDDRDAYSALSSLFAHTNIAIGDPYTLEPHAPRFFNLIFYIVGKLSIFIHQDFLWFTGSILTASFLMAVFYRVFAFLRMPKNHHSLWLFLIVMSGGISSFIKDNNALYNRWEFIGLKIFDWPVLWSLSLALFLLCLMDIYKILFGITDQKRIGTRILILSVLIGFIHPYEAITLTVSQLFFAIYALIKKVSLKRICSLIVITSIGTSLWLGYYLYLRKDPVYAAQASFVQKGPDLISVIIVFLPYFAITAFSIWKKYYSREYVFIILWLISILVLGFFPSAFSLRFFCGISFALSLLCYPFLLAFIHTKKLSKSLKTIITGMMLLFHTATFLKFSFVHLHQAIFYDSNIFTSADELIIAKYFSKFEGARIFTYPKRGSYLPRYSNTTVYAGHWYYTVNYEEKARSYEKIIGRDISQKDLTDIFQKNCLGYLILPTTSVFYFTHYTPVLSLPSYTVYAYLDSLPQSCPILKLPRECTKG